MDYFSRFSLQLPTFLSDRRGTPTDNDSVDTTSVTVVQSPVQPVTAPPINPVGLSPSAETRACHCSGNTRSSSFVSIQDAQHFPPPNAAPPQLHIQPQISLPISEHNHHHDDAPSTIENNNASQDDESEALSAQQEAILRRRISEVRKILGLSEREISLRIQNLMTENYYRLRAERLRRQQQEAACNMGMEEGSLDYGQPTALELQPSYHSENVLGCRHYQSGVKIQCSTCLRWFSCRFCHDDVVWDHQLVRAETKNMLCMHCGKAQPANEECRHCKTVAAQYYCDKCKLWDDDEQKSIYHCNECGICRIGEGLGKDFFHCKTCNVCMAMSLKDSHRCIEHSTECDCPICGEYMFTSTLTVVFLPCGHSIHQSCYYEHTKRSYKCPTCARSIVNMESQFRLLDNEIARQQPLPEPYLNWKCVIICNDCSAKSEVPFHFLGLKCDNCRSYNTAQIKLMKPEEEESEPPTAIEDVTITTLSTSDSSVNQIDYDASQENKEKEEEDDDDDEDDLNSIVNLNALHSDEEEDEDRYDGKRKKRSSSSSRSRRRDDPVNNDESDSSGSMTEQVMERDQEEGEEANWLLDGWKRSIQRLNGSVRVQLDQIPLNIV